MGVMTTNDGCRADVRKARAEAAEVDPTAAAVRAAQAEAWDEGFQDGRRQDAEGDDGPRFINPYRAERLATDTAAPKGVTDDYPVPRFAAKYADTAAPEGVLSEEYAENLIGFVRTFETGEAAASALPIFLRTATRPAAPVAVEGVETVETLAEVLATALAEHWRSNYGDGEVWRDDDPRHDYFREQGIIAARIVQARAGEGALRERIEALAADLQQDIEDRREDTPDDDGSWPITRAEWVGHIAGLGDALTQLRAALTTADPS